MSRIYIVVAILPVLLFLIAWLLVTLLRLKKEQAFVANARQKINQRVETDFMLTTLIPEDDDNLGIIPDKATLGRT